MGECGERQAGGSKGYGEGFDDVDVEFVAGVADVGAAPGDGGAGGGEVDRELLLETCGGVESGGRAGLYCSVSFSLFTGDEAGAQSGAFTLAGSLLPEAFPSNRVYRLHPSVHWALCCTRFPHRTSRPAVAPPHRMPLRFYSLEEERRGIPRVHRPLGVGIQARIKVPYQRRQGRETEGRSGLGRRAV